jgi:hypothetical protein
MIFTNENSNTSYVFAFGFLFECFEYVYNKINIYNIIRTE